MGREFGRLANVGSRFEFVLSPYEQKIMPLSSVRTGIPNFIRRFAGQLLPVGIPMFGVYKLISWAHAENERFRRKSPEDFANDQ